MNGAWQFCLFTDLQSALAYVNKNHKGAVSGKSDFIIYEEDDKDMHSSLSSSSSQTNDNQTQNRARFYSSASNASNMSNENIITTSTCTTWKTDHIFFCFSYFFID